MIALLSPLAAQAAFPEKPITIVVAFPPGGATDVLARALARQMQLQMPGSNIVVENKPGAGTPSHFAGEMFKAATGLDIVHVPYKGSAPAMQDLIGGQVLLSVDTNMAAMPQIKTGKIKPLAATTAKRLSAQPDVPTLAESGLPGFEMAAFMSLVGPRGLSDGVRAMLVNALAEVMKLPAVHADVAKSGLEVGYEPPATFEGRVNHEWPVMRALVQKAGITVD